MVNFEDYVSNTEFILLKSGDYYFSEITKLLFKNNKIYLLDGQRGHKLMIFDQFGNLLHAIKGKGNGPGEYEAASDMWVNKDGTIEVLDEYQRKVILYNQEGAFMSEKRLPFAAEKFIKTDSHYIFYTNNIAFAFNADNNETGLVMQTDHDFKEAVSILPADLNRADFYYITTQNFTQLNNEWFFFQPFTHELMNMENGSDFTLDFGVLKFPKSHFKNSKEKGVDMMNKLYNLGKAWDNGCFYDLGQYIYFKFQVNLNIYMAFYNKASKQIKVANRNNWLVNTNCFVSRYDPIAKVGNKLVFHLLPNEIKMMKDLNCFDKDLLVHIDENNVLMLWTINK